MNFEMTKLIGGMLLLIAAFVGWSHLNAAFWFWVLPGSAGLWPVLGSLATGIVVPMLVGAIWFDLKQGRNK